MNLHAWLSVAVVALVFLLLAFTRVQAYLVILAGLALLLIAGVLEPGAALEGFSNPGMITVAVLFVVVAGLRQTGLLSRWMPLLLGRPSTPRGAQARLLFPVMASSVFLNNTPIVAMMMPVVSDWAKSIRVAPSKLMIPLSYAAILGGLCSMIGTSTNLVVSGLWVKSGHEALALFDITWVGLPAAAAGALFMLTVGPRLLPDRDNASQPQEDPREYTLEMVVQPGGPLVGKTITEGGLRHLPGVFLVEIFRRNHVLPAVRPDEVLEADDQLIFAGLVDAVADLQRIPGLLPATRQVFKLDSPMAERVFAEAVVSPSCPVAGQTVRDGQFRTRYNAVVLAVSRNGERIRDRIGDILLQPGDGLLLETTPTFVEQQRNSRDFYLVTCMQGARPPIRNRAGTALAIAAGMVLLAATGVLSMLQAASLAAALMLLTRCCSEETALRVIDWPLLLAIAGALGLGRALDETGAAAAMAHALLTWSGNHPWLALAIVYAVTTILSELVTNNAAAVIVFPIAMATAASLGVSPMPFVIAIMIAASASFATPLGYQTNLMVYGAGHYRFFDFLRIGIPMNMVVGAATVGLTPLAFPFQAS